jgi:hypothetical protein
VSVVSLAEVKAELNITTNTSDGELQSFINRAEAILSKRVGPLGPVTVTDEVHTGPGPIVLKQYPVVSVDSATSSDVAVSDLDADLDAGVVHGTFGSVSRAVKVTYVAGRESLPEDLAAAVLELVRHLYESQRVPGTSRSFQGFGGGSGDSDAPAGSGYLLPYRVQSLIEPYIVPGVA